MKGTVCFIILLGTVVGVTGTTNTTITPIPINETTPNTSSKNSTAIPNTTNGSTVAITANATTGENSTNKGNAGNTDTGPTVTVTANATTGENSTNKGNAGNTDTTPTVAVTANPTTGENSTTNGNPGSGVASSSPASTSNGSGSNDNNSGSTVTGNTLSTGGSSSPNSSPNGQSTGTNTTQPTVSTSESAKDECYNFNCTTKTDGCLSERLNNKTAASPIGTCTRDEYCKIKRIKRNDNTTIQTSCTKESCNHQDYNSDAEGGQITINCCRKSLCNVQEALNKGHHPLSGFLPWIATALVVMAGVV